MAINYDSKESILECLQKNGLRLTKRFGQNFLTERKFRERIVESLDMRKDESVWEIGPGIGALTHHLIRNEIVLSVFEIDRGFYPVLEDEYGPLGNFRLIKGDFLKTWKDYYSQNTPDKIIGNLPYSVGSVIIGELVKNDVCAEKMVFTLQKEVVDRITAKPSTKEYSAFSMICQYKWKCVKLGTIPRNAFFPVPDVTSAYLSMDRDDSGSSVERDIYDTFVNDIFLSRRKTIRNNLKKGRITGRYPYQTVIECCMEAGVAPERRGETLGVEEAVCICEKLKRSDAPRIN